MTALVSVRLNDKLLRAMQANAHLLHLTQTEYIRRAIESLNHEIEHEVRNAKLKNASLKVRKSSMQVNAEFGEIDHDPES